MENKNTELVEIVKEICVLRERVSYLSEQAKVHAGFSSYGASLREELIEVRDKLYKIEKKWKKITGVTI